MRIAVVGVGPRGLSVVERVVSHTRAGGPPVELLLVEPGPLGIGVHDPQQPDHLLLNTVASQLTIFSDERMVPGAPVTPGPDLQQWCEATSAVPGPVAFDTFLPRALLGRYLGWAAQDLLDRCPERLAVRHLRTVATGVVPLGPGAVVTTADGERHVVDLAVVTVGHGLPAATPVPSDGVVDAPYPLPGAVEAVPDGATVAVLGSGLAGMDVVAALTVGRGGRFTAGGYRPSGREPRIVVVNRSGWLPCARPALPAGRRPRPARYLTAEAIAALHRAGPGGLDFRRDVEPLVRAEIRARMAGATAEQLRVVDDVLSPHPRAWTGYRQFHDAVVERAGADLREAELGLGVSLVKEGLEVLRDHREALRTAVDPPGLTAASHRWFLQEYAPLVNRVVIGPQKERIRELLQLLVAGIVQLGPGPAPELARAGDGWELRSAHLAEPLTVPVDVVVRAHLSWPSADPAVDPVGASLRRWVEPGHGVPGHLRLDRDGRPVARAGGVAGGVAVFGPVAEGASYYNHYVPSPRQWSRALTDLDRVLGPALQAAASASVATATA